MDMFYNRKNDKFSIHPLPEDREEMISLWQTTFQDSDEFANLFFDRVYKPVNTLVIKKDDKIISALQIIPYEVKTAAGIIPAAYICGVCTLTLERGKGLMSILMNEAIDVMLQRGYGIATLIPAHPWLFDIYKKYGFIHPINYCIELFYNNLPDISDEVYNNSKYHKLQISEKLFSEYNFIPYKNEYFHYFDKKQRERQCTVLHNAYDIENIIRDLKNESGNAWIALQNDISVGIIFTKPDSEKIISINEIFYNDLPTKEALIRFSLYLYNAQTAKVRIPTTIRCKSHSYGLARIIDKKIADISNLYMTLMLD